MNSAIFAKYGSNKIEFVYKLKKIANLMIAFTFFQRSAASNFTTFTGHTVYYIFQNDQKHNVVFQSLFRKEPKMTSFLGSFLEIPLDAIKHRNLFCFLL